MVGGLCDSDPFASDGFCYPESQKNEANRHRIIAVRTAWPSYWVESLLVRLGGAWCSVMTRVRVKLHLLYLPLSGFLDSPLSLMITSRLSLKPRSPAKQGEIYGRAVDLAWHVGIQRLRRLSCVSCTEVCVVLKQ